MAWMMFMIFAFAVSLVNGDDNADVVQVSLQQSFERLQNQVAERIQATPMENWQGEANQIASEMEAKVNGHPHHHSNHHHSNHHHSNHQHQKKHFTKAELKMGREFLEYNHSKLYLEAKKTIHGYTAAATVLQTAKDRQAANITDEELLTLKEPWCKELRLAYGETVCDDRNGYKLSKAWFHTKCMLEECVDGNDTHPVGCLGPKGGTRLTLLVELYDALMKQMPDLYVQVGGADIQVMGVPEACPGEEDAFLLKVKQRQNKMLARHHQIQQAMAHTKAAAEGLVATASTPSDQEHAKDSIQRAWEHICGHLKCDHGSWMDIHDAMHGHVVDLSDEGMPVRTLIEHVRSLRKTHDAVMTAVGKLGLMEMDDILNDNATIHPHAVSLYQMVTKVSTGESGTGRYESLGKELLAVADAAYALKHGSTVHLTWWPFCFKIISGANVIYAPTPKDIGVGPGGCAIKLGIAFQLSCGGKILQVVEAVFNGGTKAGLNKISCNFKVAVALACGLPAVAEKLAGAAPALAIVGAASISDWSPWEQQNELTLKVGVVIAMSLTYKAVDLTGNWNNLCFAGPQIGTGPWALGCKVNAAVGIGFVCLEAKLLPVSEADADSAKDMPMGETAYGRDCIGGNGWGEKSGWNGKNYMWCYTESGGWDYTCPETEGTVTEDNPPKTTRSEECYKHCDFHGNSYKWCYTDNWNNWDYCCVNGIGNCGQACERQDAKLLESP